MKIRNGFVTNSSSSSFIIAKKNLDKDQIEAIREHESLGEKLGMEYTNWYWDIEENEDFIAGYVSMDNFSMSDFLEKIEVPDRFVIWGEYPFSIKREDNVYLEEEQESTDWREILHNM